MKHLLFLTFFAALVLAIPMSGENGAARIATANPSKILAEMQETKDLNTKQADEQKKLNLEEQGRVGDLQKLKKDRDDFVTRNTPEWEEKTQGILQKTVELQTWAELKKAQLARKHKEELKTLFDKITTGIKEVATQKKIDLVIADYGVEIPVDLEGVTPEQLHAMIRQQNILSSNKGVDISSEVTTLLDAKYKGGK